MEYFYLLSCLFSLEANPLDNRVKIPVAYSTKWLLDKERKEGLRVSLESNIDQKFPITVVVWIQLKKEQHI